MLHPHVNKQGTSEIWQLQNHFHKRYKIKVWNGEVSPPLVFSWGYLWRPYSFSTSFLVKIPLCLFTRLMALWRNLSGAFHKKPLGPVFEIHGFSWKSSREIHLVFFMKISTPHPQMSPSNTMWQRSIFSNFTSAK